MPIRVENLKINKQDDRVVEFIYNNKRFVVDFKRRKVVGEDVKNYWKRYKMTKAEWRFYFDHVKKLLVGREFAFDKDFFIFTMYELDDGTLWLADNDSRELKGIFIVLNAD